MLELYLRWGQRFAMKALGQLVLKQDGFGGCQPAICFIYFWVIILTAMFSGHPLVTGGAFIGGMLYQMQLRGIGHTLKYQVLLMLPMLLVVAMINPAFNHYGVTVLYQLKTGPVTLEAIVYGGILAFILWTSLVWFANFNEIMTTEHFVYLFGRLAPSLSLMLSMVFRFVPDFVRKLRVIREGQQCLGKDFGQQRGLKACRAAVDELSILLTWALENGIDTADSMRSRGYGTGRRTAYSIFHFTARDMAVAAILSCLYGISLWGFCRGKAAALYNPQIMISSIQDAEGALCFGAWFLFCLFPVGFGLVGRRSFVNI